MDKKHGARELRDVSWAGNVSLAVFHDGQEESTSPVIINSLNSIQAFDYASYID